MTWGTCDMTWGTCDMTWGTCDATWGTCDVTQPRALEPTPLWRALSAVTCTPCAGAGAGVLTWVAVMLALYLRTGVPFWEAAAGGADASPLLSSLFSRPDSTAGWLQLLATTAVSPASECCLPHTCSVFLCALNCHQIGCVLRGC
jgi:hypothetical protein